MILEVESKNGLAVMFKDECSVGSLPLYYVRRREAAVCVNYAYG